MTQIPTWNSGTVNPATGRTAPGTTIGGRYALRAAVGHGGMGTVWQAADTLLRRDVAVKEVVLPPGLAPSDRDAMYERTLREARAAAALQHPAVVQVYDVVHESGRPWIVMELLDARSLADMVIEDGPLAPRAVAKIGVALLGALEVAHAIGVLHRDVKPANVLICSDGRCVLTDFGVARMPTDVQLTTPGMVLGSPHFISPERAMGQDFGPPSDLFSLGVTLYTAVEGRPPFDRGDPIETMHAVVEDPPAPPTRSGPLTRVLLGLLEKDPARRLDVATSRGMLRELLAGPLASKATGHTMTDPYAVVPSPRPPAPIPPATPSGQIGGRAMLAPGESLNDRLTDPRREGGSAGAANGAVPGAGAATHAGPGAPRQGGATAGDATGAFPSPGALAAPTGTMGAWDRQGGSAPGRHGRPAGAWSADPTSGGPAPTSGGGWSPAGPSWSANPADHGLPAAGPNRFGGPERPGGSNRFGGSAGSGGTLVRAGSGLRATGSNLVGTVRGWPRKIQIGAAAGVVAVLLIGMISLFGGDDPKPVAPPLANNPASPSAPALDTQEAREKGVAVNVPKGWTRSAAGNWVDYTDPQDKARKVRVLVEPYGGDSSRRWAEGAEGFLKKNTKSCAKPYNRVEMTDVELVGQPAAQFEYTCGDSGTGRHGVWRGVVRDGKAYSFYLTTTDATFADSRPIFEEMVRSFEIAES
ncbi:protein kinase [Plantactinospora sp. GCM10030261]|uniref:protein kinase domain-containing protein n=1 Tax=Plantactinospora sp. GCM10030261 TaxID=3273420 RepID=UPI003615B18C